MLRAPLIFGILLGSLTGCPNTGGPCATDSDCDGEVCARNSECLPTSAVRAVKVEWTVNGMPASETACASTQDLAVNFVGDRGDDAVGFAPVPCKIGQFSVDKLPTRFGTAELGRDGGSVTARSIDVAGVARFDLSP